MEFFNSIWQWFISNSNEIVVTLTSANFISFITSIVLLIKTMKSTKDNTSSTDELKAVIVETKKSNETITNIDNKLLSLYEKFERYVEDFEKYKIETTELLNLLVSKYNMMMEAQLQVWSTIKDDNIRNNVNTILTSAKYKETSVIVDLKKEIEELENKLLTKTTEIKTEVEDAVSNVKKVVNKKTNTVTRV